MRRSSCAARVTNATAERMNTSSDTTSRVRFISIRAPSIAIQASGWRAADCAAPAGPRGWGRSTAMRCANSARCCAQRANRTRRRSCRSAMRLITRPRRGAGLRTVAAANPAEPVAGCEGCARRARRTAPRARATRTRAHRSGTRVPAAAPTGGSRARRRRGRGGFAPRPAPRRAARRAPTAAADRRPHSPRAIRARPSAAAHEEPEQQRNPTRDGHGLPGVAAHVAVDVARPRGQLLLERAEPGAQLPQRGLGALLHFRAVRAAARPQQRFGIAHQRAQFLGQLPGIEHLGHGGVPRRQAPPLIYAYPYRNRETRAAGCATLTQECLYERAGAQSAPRVAQARRERLAG